MDSRVVMMEGAEEDLDIFLAYLLFGKKNEQAAKNLLDDFAKTKISLSNINFLLH